MDNRTVSRSLTISLWKIELVLTITRKSSSIFVKVNNNRYSYVEKRKSYITIRLWIESKKPLLSQFLLLFSKMVKIQTIQRVKRLKKFLDLVA